MKVKIKVLKKDPKRKFNCDQCGSSSLNTKMYRKKNFPYGRNSKPVYTNTCINCKYPNRKRLKIILKI